MKKSFLITFILGAILCGITPAFSQATGFFDDFEDQSVDTTISGTTYTLWKADHPSTFGITETDGFLNLAYDRSAGSGEWDNFHFTPPESIDVSDNPVITLKIKSDVATTFTVKPLYSNGKDDWLQKDIPADGQWHVYTYEMVEANYSGGLLTKAYLYLDGGSTEIKSGMLMFDDFQVAGFSINIINLQAVLVDSASVDLSWDSDDPSKTELFNIYRSTEAGFSPAEENRIAQQTETLFHDTGLSNYTTYYYQVSATDIEGREHTPASVSIRTSNPGGVPIPEVLSENANPVGKYEKYELLIGMQEANYENPYNPEEIDLHAWFWSPDGDSLMMNGFFDNYQGAGKWKIRFSANMPGTWEYQVFATDVDGTGSSERKNFVVEDSEYKGWPRISPDNPNYLMYDDGSSFYGLSVYYPWSVTEQGLDELKAAKLNFFGYWDCTYDWQGNGGGKNLLESMDSGLGKYDQAKAARIDQLLEWAEARDMKMMLSIWAHPYLRTEGKPWDNGSWFEFNPYSSIVEVEEFYTDSLAFAYQEKHYRYMIARFGYSRAMGIWELINEIHGTSGWVDSQTKAKLWVEKVHSYFKENDPFQRATTASFGAGDGDTHYSVGDKLGDIPNIHFYELHGFPNKYPDNIVRSGLNNVVSMNQRLKSKGERPAFFGEAGYDHMLADLDSEEYTWELHNSFWASLTTGMASTPFWWDFTSREVLTTERMQNYTMLQPFVSDIDFSHQKFAASPMYAEDVDGYFMGIDTSGFGWMYSYEEPSISEAPFILYDSELSNGSCLLQWYNTWTGEFVDTDTIYSVQGHSWGEVSDNINEKDAAFRLSILESGQPAENVNLHLLERDTLIQDPVYSWLTNETTIYKVACFLTDSEGIMDISYNGPAQLDIQYSGGEDPVQMSVDLTAGGVVFPYIPSGSSGAVVTITVEGVGSAELNIDGIVGIEENALPLATKGFVLKDAYPNPFDQATTFAYILPESSHVQLSLFDARGSLVETLVIQEMPQGSHSVEWQSCGHSSGVYFCTLSTEKVSITKRFVILN